MCTIASACCRCVPASLCNTGSSLILSERGETPLGNLHLEMVPRDGCGMVFNNQLIVRRITLQGVVGEQGGHRDHQLHFGDARTQASMVPQAKSRVGPRFPMLLARRAEPVKIKQHG